MRMDDKTPKNNFTTFLERNEIWFKTILSLAVTIAALFISLASYRTAQYQAQLSAQNLSNQDKEKQPFFSVENIYSEDDNEYIYLIKSTGGEIRSVDVELFPYLYVVQYSEDNKKLNQAFIYVPLFDIDDMNSDDSILSFRDYRFQTNPFNRELINGHLANEVFESESSFWNHETKPTSMSSYLIYDIQIVYTNYLNEQRAEHLILNRKSGTTSYADGNVILYIEENPDVITGLNNARIKGQIYNIYDYIDIITNNKEELLLNGCFNIIYKLQKDFGQQYENELRSTDWYWSDYPYREKKIN